MINDSTLESLKTQAIQHAIRGILNPNIMDAIRNDGNFREAINKLTPGHRFAALTTEEAYQAWRDSDDAARQAIKNYNPWKEEI